MDAVVITGTEGYVYWWRSSKVGEVGGDAPASGGSTLPNTRVYPGRHAGAGDGSSAGGGIGVDGALYVSSSNRSGQLRAS